MGGDWLQIVELMRALDITEAEARQLIEDDKRIDKGEKLFELSKSENEVARKMKNCARTVDAYGKTRTREKKADNDKREIMRLLLDRFDEYAPEILKEEREFLFTYNGRKFKITLSAPRN